MGRGHFVHEVWVDWDGVPRDSYVRDIPALRSLPLTFGSNVTFFTGENGSGKSTLLEAMAVAWGLNPEGGSANFRFGEEGIEEVAYEEADAYQDMHLFMTDRERLLARLLGT